jgi:hypothetical protein
MPGVSKGEIWLVDFGMVAKVRPALLLTDHRLARSQLKKCRATLPSLRSPPDRNHFPTAADPAHVARLAAAGGIRERNARQQAPRHVRVWLIWH